MNILSIETSCDETGISLVSCSLVDDNYHFDVLADNLLSQAKLHAEYGGVFPSLAKREHARAIIPLIGKTLSEAGLDRRTNNLDPENLNRAKVFLEREPEVADELESLQGFDTSTIDAITVTVGPGLSPSLWVGVNTARALSLLWDKPLIPVNHMHGHIFSALFPENKMYELPALALLVSGGHTELLALKENLDLEHLGGTRDDAIGEAFDKASRVLGLGYPGGPEISRLATEARKNDLSLDFKLPRPMVTDDSFDVSYSGLKTALIYHVRDNPLKSESDRQALAREFEDAAIDVILSKVRRALETDSFKSLVVGGGVIANTELRQQLESLTNSLSLPLYLPSHELTTDNSLMIAVAGFVAFKNNKTPPIKADKMNANANLDSATYVES